MKTITKTYTATFGYYHGYEVQKGTGAWYYTDTHQEAHVWTSDTEYRGIKESEIVGIHQQTITTTRKATRWDR